MGYYYKVLNNEIVFEALSITYRLQRRFWTRQNQYLWDFVPFIISCPGYPYIESKNASQRYLKLVDVMPITSSLDESSESCVNLGVKSTGYLGLLQLNNRGD